MQVDALKLIYFSPTQTTRKIAGAIAEGFGISPVDELNLTVAQARSRNFPPVADGLAIIGMPVYAGRLPEEAVARLRRVRGNGTPAIIVVLYGNRAYDDALIELRDVAIATGFVPVAAGAFIGEHSFATDAAQIAMHRPDASDFAKARDFGKAVRAMMNGISDLQQLPSLPVPGNVPYIDCKVLKQVAPVSDNTLCTRCGKCVTVCPTNAIAIRNDVVVTDASQCILCCACVKACAVGGRALLDERIGKLRGMLVSKFSERKEPETFLAR